MATYDYETLGEKFVAANTRARVHRVFPTGDSKRTICECYDFDSVVLVVNALNDRPQPAAFQMLDEGGAGA